MLCIKQENQKKINGKWAKSLKEINKSCEFLNHYAQSQEGDRFNELDRMFAF